MARPKRKLEDPIHIAILTFIRFHYPRVLVYHVPNGGSRNIIEAKNLKRLGVMAGVADLVVHWSFGKTGYLEVKPPNGKLSKNQKIFKSRCEELGLPYRRIDSVDQVCTIFKEWGIT